MTRKNNSGTQTSPKSSPPDTWHTAAKYGYTDESGASLSRVIRRERSAGAEREKAFYQERHENGRWIKGLKDTRRVPYRLHKVVKAKRVFIAEGEKDADTLRKKLKVTATTNPMGAGKWPPEFAQYFKHKHVIILPDNDAPGRKHALTVAGSLLPVAASVRVVELPDLPEKGDVTDWVRAGGTHEKLEQFVTTSPALDDAGLAKLRKRWGLDVESVTRQSPFRVTEKGVFWLGGKDGPIKLAAQIDVIAQTRDDAGENWGRLLRWRDNEGRIHRWAMPMEMLASDAGAVRARLLGEGLPYIAANARLRERFTEYLQTAATAARARCVGRVGWHGDSYALPEWAITPDGGEEVLYQTPHEAAHHWSIKGSAEEWRESVGQRCAGNSRLILAVSSAFAGPLLSLLGAESGGIHFHGATSTGKSTALTVGGSVCGGGGQSGFVQSWRTTINGLEAIAEAHNDATLFLDELSQVDAHVAGETAYLLGNGQGKQRMTRTMGARKKLAWRLLFVSAGELTLGEHAASAGKRTRGGGEVRLLNVAADAGASQGLFENLHGSESPDAFARDMKEAALRSYGAPLRSFLERLVKDTGGAVSYVQKRRSAFIKECVPSEAPGEVRRAADRFALIGAAGELATGWGLTGWSKGEAIRAAKHCFESWLAARGTTGSSDMEAAVKQIRRILQTDGIARFPLIEANGTVHKDQSVRDQAGFRHRSPKSGKSEFWIFTEVFRSEFCNGYSAQAVAKELCARGCLRRTEPHLTIKVRLPGFKDPKRVYCIREAILGGDNAD